MLNWCLESCQNNKSLLKRLFISCLTNVKLSPVFSFSHVSLYCFYLQSPIFLRRFRRLFFNRRRKDSSAGLLKARSSLECSRKKSGWVFLGQTGLILKNARPCYRVLTCSMIIWCQFRYFERVSAGGLCWYHWQGLFWSRFTVGISDELL